jgi:hypothetical protein
MAPAQALDIAALCDGGRSAWRQRPQARPVERRNVSRPPEADGDSPDEEGVHEGGNGDGGAFASLGCTLTAKEGWRVGITNPAFPAVGGAWLLPRCRLLPRVVRTPARPRTARVPTWG